MLNSDQQTALAKILNWWKGKELNFILDGAGGTGKSYLLDEVIENIPCEPLILTPTHEALKQVRDKIKGDFLFRTIHSALGIAPTTDKEELSFEQIALPSFWDDINLVIIDECSMVSEEILDILLSLGRKILFVGHSSQLPPVKVNKGIFDKCISPVFNKGFPSATLTIPMRNTGALWDFNNHLEKMIYTNDRIIPNTFDIKKQELNAYVNSEEGKAAIFRGDAKFVLWSNKEVDNYNNRIRVVLFGEQAKKYKYLTGDKILLTKPARVIEQLETYPDSALARFVNDKDIPSYYANTKAEVISCRIVDVVLNKNLSVKCYKIDVLCEGDKTMFYEPVYFGDYKKIEDCYKHLAWSKKSYDDKRKAFKLQHFMVSLFASIKHAYAQTSHRLQGSSLQTVIVIDNDISKNMNIIEQKKCRYVACSRVISKLMFYRGT